jgi:Putative peptidoglycan binding domain
MKKIKLITLAGTALVGLSQLVWAGPLGGGGGHVGGFSGGAHFGGGHVSSYAGGFRGAPLSSVGGARFNGGTVGAVTRTPQQFYYYSGNRTSGLTQHAFIQQTPNRSTTQYTGSRTTLTHQQNRAASAARQDSRIGKSQMTAAAVRRAIASHNVARHDANWHRDWNKHRFHRHNGLVFVFLDGFWWGLSPAYFPWAYYPYYAYDDNPYDYYSSPYDYYDHDDQSAYTDSDQYGNSATLSAVQSELAKLGYYQGQIDGVEGDETQAALAHYQQDHDLSVTGTLTAATLQSLGLARRSS